jgi:hypothetical protein
MKALFSKVSSRRLACLRATFAILALVCFSSAPVWGQAWNGSANNLWFNGANWDGGSAPNSTGATVSILNALNNPVALSGGASVGTLALGATNSLNVGLGSILNVYGPSISNAGSIRLNGGSGTNAVLELQGSTTLSGGGTVTLNSGDNSGGAYILQGVGGLTLTNADNTIQGYGTINYNGLTVVNQGGGTIDANVSGQSLALSGAALTNAGTLEATGGGILAISQNVANAGGTISGNGGSVQFTGSLTIQGGTLTSASGGTLLNKSFVTLDGSNAGAVTLSTGSTWTGQLGSYTYVQGSIVNHGTFLLNGGSGSNALMGLLNNTTLSGGGTVTLNSGDNNGQAYIFQQAGGTTLTNADNTIQGYGIIGNNGLTLVNQAAGTIDANVSGQTLLLNGGGITNSGTLEATNGGILSISGNTVNNAGASITANAGSVLIQGSTIVGGTLAGLNGGTFGQGNNSTVTLDGSTAGALTLSSGSSWTTGPGSITYVQGSIVNHGAFALDAGSGGSTSLALLNNTTLSGGGTVTLNSGDNNGQVYIYQQAGGLTLTNADNTIQGYGEIGNNGLRVVNGASGTLLANSVGNTLLVDASGGLTNNGTLQANAGSTLQVTSNLTNFSGSTLTGGTYFVNGGASQAATLQLNIGTIAGGGEIVNNAANIVLSGAQANFFNAAGVNALSNLQNNLAGGSFTVQNGQQFQDGAPGGLTNAGAVIVSAGSGFTLNGGYTQTGGTTRVDGTLAAGDGWDVLIQGGTLSGVGQIGSSVVIQAGGTLSPGDSPGMIGISGNYIQAGTLFEEIGGTGSGQFDVTHILGAADLTGGILDVDLTGGFAPAPGADYTFTILTAVLGITGTFNVDFLNLPVGATYGLDYSHFGEVILEIDGPTVEPSSTPEPASFATMLLAGIACAAGVWMRRRRTATA